MAKKRRPPKPPKSPYRKAGDVTCKCGAKYELESLDLPESERGSIPCEACGAEVYDWDCSASYIAKRVS